MQVDGPREGTSSRHEDAAVVAPCEQVMIGEELDLGHCCHFRLQGLDLLTLYTKRWFMNHCYFHVTPPHYLIDCNGAKTKPTPKGCASELRVSSDIHLTDICYLLSGKHSTVTGCSHHLSRASHLVVHIILMRAFLKMLWIDAARVIAFVADDPPGYRIQG